MAESEESNHHLRPNTTMSGRIKQELAKSDDCDTREDLPFCCPVYFNYLNFKPQSLLFRQYLICSKSRSKEKKLTVYSEFLPLNDCCEDTPQNCCQSNFFPLNLLQASLDLLKADR